jgi:hypothetical protein
LVPPPPPIAAYEVIATEVAPGILPAASTIWFSVEMMRAGSV